MALLSPDFPRRCLLIAACCIVLAGCKTPGSPGDAAAGAANGAAQTANGADGAEGTKEAVDVSFLLSMTWKEAKTINPQHLEIPPFYKVAADEVKVLKSDEAGRPLRVRAKGHVFMQVDFREQLTSLGQEAYIESGGELIMRGKPLLKRGRSLVEGLTDMTVFYIRGTRLQVIGSHRLTKQEGGGESFSVMPTWSRSWKEGPNPLLPALSPDDVPKEMRVNPLLPPPDGGDVPKTLPDLGEKGAEPGGAKPRGEESRP
jgi:hypothetical protein